MTQEREAQLLASVPDKLFIAGKWVESSSGKKLDVFDPATGKTIKSIADGTADDAQKAMDAAADAQDSWAATAPRERSDLLRRAFNLLAERAEDFALLMTIEMGKPLSEAMAEVKYGNEFLRWFSEEAVRIQGRYGSNPEGTGMMIVTQRPVGP
ncbi:MAG: aldehyde dehydrogenase family protein, partial [Microbacteriaceae bacterium]|nr:aldehyde dehydrogenase family protein [Microbacteriaceae bacterium]